MRKTWLTKDEKIELLEEQVTKYKFLFDKAQGMLDHDEIKRLRHKCVEYARIERASEKTVQNMVRAVAERDRTISKLTKQVKQLEKMKGIKWNPNPTDLPIM